MKVTSGKYLKVTTERELNPSSFFHFSPLKIVQDPYINLLRNVIREKNQQNEILASVFLPPT